MGQEPKTGGFHLQVALMAPDALDEEKASGRLRLLNKMMHQVAVILQDGRVYELRAQLIKELLGDQLSPGGWLRLDFSLVLLEAEQAEVGEWVKDLPHAVPDHVTSYGFGDGCGELEGRCFERGRLGWKRVE